MVQVSYPGVYVVEVPSGVHTITGVSTAIAAFFGRATRGPVNKAVRCLSFTDYVRNFGDPHPLSDLSDSVRLFFANGGTDCYVVRLARNAAKASVTLRNQSFPVLVATAKTEGVWGNAVRLEVDYNTPNPDATFRLHVIHEEAGVEIARETHVGLSMDPSSAGFAPTFVSASSDLIDLALAANLGTAQPNDLNVLGNSFAGYSQSRVFLTTPIATFRTEFEALLTGSSNLLINVDETGDVPINLSSALGPTPPQAPPGAWSLAVMQAAIAAAINTQLSAVNPALSVTATFQTSGDYSVLRIISATPAAKSVQIKRASTNDFTTPTLFGLDQNGIEVPRFSNFRPVPTGAYYTGVDNAGLNTFLALGRRLRDDITSIAINGQPPIPFSFTYGAGTDPWFRDPTGGVNGVRDKLLAIAKAINTFFDTTVIVPPAVAFRAEVWGYHLALIPRESSANFTPSAVVSAVDTTLGAANFTRNVRRYSLGPTGSGPHQVPGTAGSDGIAPDVATYIGNPVPQTGFHALDSVDLFNLMVLPADQEVTQAQYLQIIGPASTYCQSERAFLIVDAPTAWTNANTKRPTATAVDVNNLRALVVKDHSGVYYPRVKVLGGPSRTPRFMGPSGIIAGLMSRIDGTAGVWKAPAGVDASLREVLDVEVNLTDRENGVLNKLAVNCIRKFPSGIVNWGARTLDGSDDIGSEWKYVPIRRLALFLEESLYRGTTWAVFQPNDEPLWAQLRMNIGAFMMGLFRQGAFQGSTPDTAFFVQCDAETTTQADRNLGIVNIVVGFAPLKPAEFVIIKIQQIAGQLV